MLARTDSQLAQLAIGPTAVTAQATVLRLVAGGIALATAHLT
jgi:hypothetical protein